MVGKIYQNTFFNIFPPSEPAGAAAAGPPGSGAHLQGVHRSGGGGGCRGGEHQVSNLVELVMAGLVALLSSVCESSAGAGSQLFTGQAHTNPTTHPASSCSAPLSPLVRPPRPPPPPQAVAPTPSTQIAHCQPTISGRGLRLCQPPPSLCETLGLLAHTVCSEYRLPLFRPHSPSLQ